MLWAKSWGHTNHNIEQMQDATVGGIKQTIAVRNLTTDMCKSGETTTECKSTEPRNLSVGDFEDTQKTN